MKKIFNLLLGEKENTILYKMIRILLGSNLMIILVLVIIAFYGIGSVLYQAEEMGQSLGDISYKDSTELLVKQRKEELLFIAGDNAKIINMCLGAVGRDVEAVASEAREIQQNPEKYLPRTVSVPNKYSFRPKELYLQYGPEVKPENHRREISNLANIGNILIRMVESDDMAMSFFVTSSHDYTLSVDAPNKLNDEEDNIPQTIYSGVESDWYKKAVEKGGLVYTDVRMFTFSKKPGIFCAAPYYDNNGELSGVASMQISLETLRNIIKDLHLPNAGFCFALDQSGKVIISSQSRAYEAREEMELAVDLKDDIRESKDEGLGQIAREMTMGHSGVQLAEIDNEEYFVAYMPIELTGWSFATVFAKDDVIAPLEENKENIEAVTAEKIADLKEKMVGAILFMIVAILLLLWLVIYQGRRISGRFVASIQTLAEGVREITVKAVVGTLFSSGELPEKEQDGKNGIYQGIKRVEINTGDEIQELADCFNIMTEELEGYMANLTAITAEKERISTELNLARDIQNGVLPHKFPPFPEYKEFLLHATMRSAKEVGGDFYDFYMVDENRLAITIADVSGKGVGAALFMAISKTMLKNLILGGRNRPLADIISQANNQLKENNTARMFVTVFVGILDIRTGHFEYVNGGHNPPLVYEKEKGAFRYLDVVSNFVLAGRKNMSFESQTISLKPGDSLFLYTDGVTEAMNVKEELYGEERLLAALNASQNTEEPQTLLEEMNESVTEFAGDEEQSDDITMLGLTYLG